MKKIILLIFCLISVNLTFAQSGCPSPIGRYKAHSLQRFQVGTGVGITSLKGDRKNSNAFGAAGYFNFDYQLIKGLFFGVRTQFGSLRMKPVNFNDKEMNSRFFGFGGGILIHPFELINKDTGRQFEKSIGNYILESFYLGADVLSLQNSFKYIHRSSPLTPDSYGPIDYYDQNGNPVFKDKVSTLLLPALSVGISPILNKNNERFKIRAVVNAQFNFTDSDELDGFTPYDANMQRIKTNNDWYSFYSLGLRCLF